MKLNRGGEPEARAQVEGPPSLLLFSVVRESLSTLAAVVHNTEVQTTFKSNVDHTDTVSSRVVRASDLSMSKSQCPGILHHSRF
jgi:hypothetical protein